MNAGAAPLAGGDYRALVCVFLYGGNDGNNTVIPVDSAGYSAYAKARGNASGGGLALQQSSLALLNGATVGLHPGLTPLAEIWNQGHLAIQANVGTLVQPLTKASYAASAAFHPPSLFSHADQQSQWMHGISGPVVTTGWGGRIADLQGHTNLPTVLSVSGNSVFINGASTAGLAIPAKGGFTIRGFGNVPSTRPTALDCGISTTQTVRPISMK